MAKMHLYVADIRELKHYEAAALPLLAPERRTEAECIKLERDRLHCIAAGLLLRCVLGVTEDKDLVQDSFGKRRLAGEGPCFSLSHGGNYAVLALSDGAVGVDIEPVEEKIPITIPRRWLQPDELTWLEEEITPERFVWLWTRLESALKADGRGFGMGQRAFSVLHSGKPWYLETLDYDSHMISCASCKPFEVDIVRLQTNDLLNEKLP